MSHPRHEQRCPFDDPRVRAAEYAGDDEFAALYNIAPVLPGHSLVVPRRHIERLGLLSDDELCQFFVFARKITDFLLSQFTADGFDWTIQDGLSAGQTVSHLHLHVIPRWPGDLPSPGDWYTRLKLPAAANSNAVIDSTLRPRLSNSELNTIVTVLRSAAAEVLRPSRRRAEPSAARELDGPELSGAPHSVRVMPSTLHEALVELFRHRPALAAELLSMVLGMEVPAYHAARLELESAECVNRLPTEHRADAVVVLRGRTGLVLAVLSAMAHGAHPGRSGVLDALVTALGTVEPGRVLEYLELVYAALPDAARTHLEALMSTETHEPLTAFRRMLEAKSMAQSVATILEARGIPVPDAIRARIDDCRDIDQLDAWIRRASTAETVDELFT